MSRKKIIIFLLSALESLTIDTFLLGNKFIDVCFDNKFNKCFRKNCIFYHNYIREDVCLFDIINFNIYASENLLKILNFVRNQKNSDYKNIKEAYIEIEAHELTPFKLIFESVEKQWVSNRDLKYLIMI